MCDYCDLSVFLLIKTQMLIEIELMLIKIMNIAKMIDTRHAVHPGGTAQHAPKKYGHLRLSLMWLASVSVDKNSNVDRNELMLIKMKIIEKITLVILFTSRHCTTYINCNLVVVVMPSAIQLCRLYSRFTTNTILITVSHGKSCIFINKTYISIIIYQLYSCCGCDANGNTTL